MTDTPIIAQKGPFAVEVTAGMAYFWCACGRSQKQPFCDGRHKVTTLRPVKHVAEKGGDAIALIGVDEKLSPAVLAEIAALPQVREAKALVF